VAEVLLAFWTHAERHYRDAADTPRRNSGTIAPPSSPCGRCTPSYACRKCEQASHDPQFTRPPLPVEPLPRSSVASGLLAHVVVSKFVDQLPLYRQEQILARHGFGASRSTLCDWRRGCAALLGRLYHAMLTRVTQSHTIHVDDTPGTSGRPSCGM
jgi:hypothetical protein